MLRSENNLAIEATTLELLRAFDSKACQNENREGLCCTLRTTGGREALVTVMGVRGG